MARGSESKTSSTSSRSPSKTSNKQQSSAKDNSSKLSNSSAPTNAQNRGSENKNQQNNAPETPFPELAGESGQLTKEGKVRIRKKYFVTNKDDLQRVVDLPGYKPTSISYNKIGGGAYEQEVEYAAQIELGASAVLEELQGDYGTFETISSYERVAISQHPQISKLLLDFGGYTTNDGEPMWPMFYTGLDGTKTRNPMYGVKSYKVPTMTFRHTYTIKGMPPRSIYNKAGKQITYLPAGFPSPYGPLDEEDKEIKLRWLALIPQLYRDGDTTRIIQEYELIDAAPGLGSIYDATGEAGSITE